MPEQWIRATRGLRATRDASGRHFLSVKPITPNVVDDYGTVWKADAFDASLHQRMPVLAWAHDWSEPIGKGVAWQRGADGPTIKFQFSDFNDVPRARQAFSQVADETLTDVSVGFWVGDDGRRALTAAEQQRWPRGKELITRAQLDEVSLVLRGAVPGAKVLAVRSGTGREVVEEEYVLWLAREVSAGRMTNARAKALLAQNTKTIGASPRGRTSYKTRQPVRDRFDREIDKALHIADEVRTWTRPRDMRMPHR